MKSKFSVFFFLLSLSVLFTGQALAMTVSYDQKVSIDSNPVATIKVLVREEQMRAESDFNGVVSVPVSYTHLDVYKRQAGTRVRSGFPGF